MQTLRLQPDQWTAVGRSMTFAVTDIDGAGVRLLVRGQIIGGPEDGAAIDRPVEVAVGSEARIGIVTIALIDTKPGLLTSSAKVGVFCPPHLDVRPVKETK